MLHKFGAKILCVGASQDAFASCAQAFGDQALVLAAHWTDEGPVTLTGPDGATQLLTNPAQGPTIIAGFAPDQDAIIETITHIWTDALQPAPVFVDVADTPEALNGVQTALMEIQTGLMTDAMRRNVDLLGQVAALRLRAENLNTTVTTLKEVLVRSQGDAACLLHEGKRWGEPIALAPGRGAVQRLPIAVLPAIIGAVSATVVAKAASSLTLTVRAVDYDQVLGHLALDLPSGRHIAFVPLTDEINPNARYVEIRFENTGAEDVALEGAFQESPEEGLRLDGDTKDAADAAVRSARLGLWSVGPKAGKGAAQAATRGTSYEVSSNRRRLVASWDIWRNNAARLTPGFEQRDWVAKRGSDGLMVHPLPDTVAIAGCPVKGRGSPFIGVRTLLSLPEKASSAVWVRLIVTQQAPTFQTADQAADFGNADETASDLARSDWVTVLPGTSRPITAFSKAEMTEGVVNIAVLAQDQSIAFGHLVASKLELFVE